MLEARYNQSTIQIFRAACQTAHGASIIYAYTCLRSKGRKVVIANINFNTSVAVVARQHAHQESVGATKMFYSRNSGFLAILGILELLGILENLGALEI